MDVDNSDSDEDLPPVKFIVYSTNGNAFYSKQQNITTIDARMQLLFFKMN